MIKKLGFLGLFLSIPALALVPVEGILMGEAHEAIQSDPLRRIFSHTKEEKGLTPEQRKIKYYNASYTAGMALGESCSYLGAPEYSTPWQNKQIRRNVVATLQYIGLDTTIKAIGAYAHKMGVEKEEFSRLSQNLIRNYCSQNVTVFSLKTIEKSLAYYFENPDEKIIPGFSEMPGTPVKVVDNSEKQDSRSREFDLVVKNFRAFCSWGGDAEDYRLLASFLNNKFIMSFVFKNMTGVKDYFDPTEEKVVPKFDTQNTVQVGCRDLICRKMDYAVFKKFTPESIGSTGLETDLAKLYCHHFRYQSPKGRGTVPQVAKWIKDQELEDPIFETNQFISLMTGIPDLMSGAEDYVDVPSLIKTSVDERWTKWANSTLGFFSQDLLYEESLKIKVEPRRNTASIAMRGFSVDLSVTVGEIDRILSMNDKISMSFDLKLSKNFMRSLKTKWTTLQNNIDLEGQKEFRADMARYIDIQLKEKQKLFTNKMWTDEFARLIVDELIGQVMLYQGPLFESYKDEVLSVPVRFNYGFFALSYIRYRADVASGRLKYNL